MVDGQHHEEPRKWANELPTEGLDPYVASILTSHKEVVFGDLTSEQIDILTKYFDSVKEKIARAYEKRTPETDDVWHDNAMICNRFINNFETFKLDAKIAESNAHHTLQQMVRTVRSSELIFDEMLQQ